MTSNRPPKSYTAPKARPTPRRDEGEVEAQVASNRRVTLQWAAVILVGLVIFALVVAFGSGSGGDYVPGVGGHG